MKHKKKFLTFSIVLAVLLLWFYMISNIDDNDNSDNDVNNAQQQSANNKLSVKNEELSLLKTTEVITEIVIAVVACGFRLQETLNMLKSAIIFNTDNIPLKFIVVSDEDLMTSFKEKFDDWLSIDRKLFTYQILPLTFPNDNNDEWRNLFKPCAAQRLFLPSLLNDIDSILYMDTDTMFLSSITDIWQFFKKFNDTQIAGLSPEHEDSNVGWYNRFAKHPFYGLLGINSGVMLMNLTRMRAFKWEQYILPVYKEYKLKITWGDQDIINILFYYHPDKLFVFPCEHNYRPDHCMYMSVCKAEGGIRILHGNRGYFHSDKQPVFSTIYATLEAYQLGTNVYRNFLQPLELLFNESTINTTNCGKIKNKFLERSRILFKNSNYNNDNYD